MTLWLVLIEIMWVRKGMVPERGRIWRVINLRQAAMLADLYTARSPAFYLSFSFFISIRERLVEHITKGRSPKTQTVCTREFGCKSEFSQQQREWWIQYPQVYLHDADLRRTIPRTHLCDTHKSLSEACIYTFYDLSECTSIHTHIYICRHLCKYTPI